MAITIGSNIASLQSQRRLFDTSNKLATVFERLASGQRINRASDDAAGLAISETLRSQSRVFAQGIRNINDGISALNIADGATAELTKVVERLQELASQSANGVFSAQQRQALDNESFALTAEYNRIIASTEFNGRKLLDGSFSSAAIEFGYDEGIFITPGGELGQTVASGAVNGDLDFFSGGNDAVLDVGDFDGDGDEDLLTVNSATGQIRLLENDGAGGYSVSGSFSAITTLPGNPNLRARFVDYDEDGDLDILTFADGGPSSSGVYRNDGGGSLSFTVGITTFERGFAQGDFNGDGNQEVLLEGDIGQLVQLDSNGMQILTGLGAFVSTGEMFAADFNGDGIDDLLSVRSGQTDVYFGSASGLETTASVTLGYQVSGTGDFDGDGNLDLVSGSTIRFGDGSGSFNEILTVATGLPGTDTVNVVDYNSDGIDDIVFSDNGQGISFLAGNEGRAYSAITNLDGDVNVNSFRGAFLADANGDGALDFLSGEDVFISQTAESNRIERLDLSTRSSSLAALDTLEEVKLRLAGERANTGAILSRLEVALKAVDATRENYIAADSRIRDADVAEQTANLTRLNILQQAAASVLSQANQQPSLALTLLG